MFEPDSRYAGLTELTFSTKDSDGVDQTILYKERRFLPLDDRPAVVEHRVAAEERLDLVTAQYIGDPQQFWLICDANQAMRPDELTQEIGNIIQIKLPGL